MRTVVVGVVMLLMGFGFGWILSPPYLGDGLEYEPCDVQDVFLTWTTPGLYASDATVVNVPSHQLARSHWSLPVADADPWDRFDGNATWSQVAWEDHTGQHIRLRAIGDAAYVAAHLDEGQQQALDSFLTVISPLRGEDLRNASDAIWATADGVGSDIKGRHVLSRFSEWTAPLSLDGLQAFLDLQLIHHDVGHWQGIGGGFTVSVHVPVRAVSLAGHTVLVDAGDRAEGGRPLIAENATLADAAAQIAAAFGVQVDSPRLKADVFCSDIDSTWLL